MEVVKFLHAAVACSSRDNSRLFFSDLLGLALARTYTAPAALMKQLFGIEEDVEVEAYSIGDAQIEVFIVPGMQPAPAPGHVCVAVRDAEGFLGRCRAGGLEVRSAAKGESFVHFVLDRDGNMYEVKELVPPR